MKRRHIIYRLASVMLAVAFTVCPNVILAKAAEEDYSLVNVPSDDGELEIRGNEETVTVIVELDSKPILERDSSVISGSEFTNKARKMRDSLLSEQEKVRDKIEKKIGVGKELESIYSYTMLTNAFATEMTVSQISQAAAVDGVKSVYIAPEFEALAEVDGGSTVTLDYSGNSFMEGAYSGEGTVIAVIDTGIDIDHEAFANAPASPKISQSDIAGVLSGLNAYSSSGGSASSYYYSSKIPFFYNYANKNFDVSHVNVAAGDHGSHVAGIAAGSAKDSEGNITFSGVAPDAQLLVMKVFKSSTTPSAGASTADLIAAIEDAILLGADVINYSLGSVGGFSYAGQSPAFYNIFESLDDAGVAAVSAAGNSYTAGYGNKYGNDLSLASNPDNGSIATPASFENNFAVASFGKTGYIFYNGVEMEFTNNYSDYTRNMLRYLNQTLGIALLRDSSGTLLTGTESEFASYAEICGISGKFVMIRRGQNFIDTAQRAENYGAIGLIVCNHSSGALTNMAENTSVSIPSIFISKENGDYIVENYENCQSFTVAYAENGQMSDFSSVGVTPELQLKPEISALGAAVFSATDNNTYGLKSGTSMAAPYFSGAYAVVLQYLNTEYPDLLSGMTAGEKKSFAECLLMSAAKPMTDEQTSAFYSPRRQGSGAVDIEAAMNSGAVLYSPGLSKPKLSLGDDKLKTGVYTMSFVVKNFSDTPLQYAASATVLTEVAENETVTYQTDVYDESTGQYQTAELAEKFMSGRSRNITPFCSVTISDGGNITVPAGECKTVTVTVAVSSVIKNYMDANFENGIYVDGFIQLHGGSATSDLSIPYLAFYGDWTQAPVLDGGTWLDTLAGIQKYPAFGSSAAYTFTKAPAYSISELYKIGTNYNLPGQQAFAANDITYNPSRISLASRTARPSITSDQLWNNTIYKTDTYLLRSASYLLYRVKNADTGEVYATSVASQVPKTYYKSSTGEVIYAGYNSGDGFSWNGKTDQGANLPDGTRVRFELFAGKTYGPDGASTYNKTLYSFDMIIDSTVPMLSGVSFYRNESNELCGTFSAYDKHYINSINVTIRGVNSGGNAAYVTKKYICGFDNTGETAVYNLNLTQASSGTLSNIYAVDVEVDDWAGNGRLNNKGSGNNGRYVFCFNDSVGFTNINEYISEGESFSLSASNHLYQSPAAQNGVNDNDAFGINTLEFTSSDSSVVTVDSSGRIYGVSTGTATITYRDICSGVSDSFTVTVQPNMLQSMINGASPGDTVDYTFGDISGNIIISKDITIDLNGAKITSYADVPAFTITNSANVTIKNGSVESTLYYNENGNGTFLDAVFGRTSAISVISGTLSLSEMTVKGASYRNNGIAPESAMVGNGVKLASGASLNIAKCDIYGLYAVDNEAGSTVTLTDGCLFGVLSAASNFNVQSVAAAKGSLLYNVSDRIADILSEGTYETSAVTALCAVVDNASYDVYVKYENGNLNIGLEFEDVALPQEYYGYTWVPSEMNIIRDGETASTFSLDGSEHVMYELTGMPQGEYSVSVSFRLNSRLTEEQEKYLLNTDGALSYMLELYDMIMAEVPSFIYDSLDIPALINAKDYVSTLLSTISTYFSIRDSLGVDCPLTQDCADLLTPGLTGLGISDDYGRTWSEYYENYVYYLIYGGTSWVTTENGEYISSRAGETFVGLLPLINMFAGNYYGLEGGLLGELTGMISELIKRQETTQGSIAERLAYINENIPAMFDMLNEMSAVMKSGSLDVYSPDGFGNTLIDTLMSDSLSMLNDGTVDSFESAFGTVSVSEFADAIDEMLAFCGRIREIESCEDYLAFDAYNDSEGLETILTNALNGKMSEYVTCGCISLFSEVKVPSSVCSYNRIIYRNTEGAANENPHFYTTGSSFTLNDAHKAGYVFMGWYSDAGFGEEYRVTEITADFSGDIELYARFTLGSYVLRFVADGVTVRETEYQYGEPINETPPEVPEKEGYIGYWDKFIPDTMPSGDYIITAVYFAVGDENQVPVSVEVIGGGRVEYEDSLIITNSRYKFTIGNEVTFTARETYPDSFLYWVRKETNRIVSTDLQYTFTAASGVDYEAVFCTPGEYRNVTYQGSYGNILYSAEIPVGSDEIDIPEIPVLEGRNIIGWDKEIADYQNLPENVLVTAQYETIAQQFTVTLTNTEKVSGAGSYDALSVVTITALGDNFSYWIDETGAIVSYQASYSFIICFDCTFTAVFEGAVTPLPVIRISKVSKNLEEKNLTFYAERSIPQGYTILETGMILTNLSAVGGDENEFTLENPYVLKGTSDSKLNNGTYSVTITDYTETDYYYARGYVILKDSNGVTLDTLYSETAVSPPDY